MFTILNFPKHHVNMAQCLSPYRFFKQVPILNITSGTIMHNKLHHAYLKCKIIATIILCGTKLYRRLSFNFAPHKCIYLTKLLPLELPNPSKRAPTNLFVFISSPLMKRFFNMNEAVIHFWKKKHRFQHIFYWITHENSTLYELAVCVHTSNVFLCSAFSSFPVPNCLII